MTASKNNNKSIHKKTKAEKKNDNKKKRNKA